MNKKTKQLVLRALQKNEAMASKFSSDELESVVESIGEDVPAEKWWVIALKVLAYLIGLLLAGVGTAEAATTLLPWMR